MKLFFIFFLLATCSFFISSCSDWTEEHDRFVNTYRDIVALRMMFPDTAVANKKVDVIYQRNGYTKESFKEAFFEYSLDHDLFRAMIDSARQRARRDYIKLDSLNHPTEDKIKTKNVDSI